MLFEYGEYDEACRLYERLCAALRALDEGAAESKSPDAESGEDGADATQRLSALSRTLSVGSAHRLASVPPGAGAAMAVDPLPAPRRSSDASAAAANLLSNLSVVHAQRGDSTAASNALYEALKRAPENTDALNNAACLLMAQRRYAQAAPLLQAALRANGEQPLLLQLVERCQE
jgi:tetratricopeptide (TPR) repeat protein